jgi:hypothetical protein
VGLMVEQSALKVSFHSVWFANEASLRNDKLRVIGRSSTYIRFAALKCIISSFKQGILRNWPVIV